MALLHLFSVVTAVTSTSVFPAQTSAVSRPAITTSIPVHAVSSSPSTGLVESHGLHLPSNYFYGAVAPPPTGAALIRVSAPTTSLASFSLPFIATTAGDSQNKNSEDHLVFYSGTFFSKFSLPLLMQQAIFLKLVHHTTHKFNPASRIFAKIHNFLLKLIACCQHFHGLLPL